MAVEQRQNLLLELAGKTFGKRSRRNDLILVATSLQIAPKIIKRRFSLKIITATTSTNSAGGSR